MALHVLFPKSVTEKDSLPVTQKLFKSLLKSKQKQNLKTEVGHIFQKRYN